MNKISNAAIMASPAATNIISHEQYDEKFASSGSESEDKNSDIDISVSEASESQSEDSAERADEDEPSWTVHISFRQQELRLNFPKTQQSKICSNFCLVTISLITFVAKMKLYMEQKRSESEKETLCAMQEEKAAAGGAKQTVYNCTHCGVALCKYPCFLLYHSQL